MKPADMEDFWERTKEQLAKNNLNASLEQAPDLSGRDFTTYGVAMDSFQGRRRRG